MLSCIIQQELVATQQNIINFNVETNLTDGNQKPIV